MIPTEVIATFEHGGATYEIDHLGIALDSQYGEFAVYRDGVQLVDFSSDAAGYRPEYRPALPDTKTLIELAKQALADAEQE
jgi:hypothetical protein